MSILIVFVILFGSVSDDFEFSISTIYETYRVNGEFMGFEIGDFIHTVLRDENREIRSFWSTDSLMDYFLSIHQGDMVTLEIRDADCYIHELADTLRIELVIGVTVDGLTYTQWRDSLETEGDPEDLLGNYFNAPNRCRFNQLD